MNRIFLAFSLLILLLAGCNSNVPLRGKVVFSDDGSPVPIGTVMMSTGTYLARADLKPDGTFVVGSLKETDGLPAGIYRVSIAGAKKIIGYKASGDEILESLIDEKFEDRDTSGITIDVTSSTKFIEIPVDRYQKK